jgi:hypothetical protein
MVRKIFQTIKEIEPFKEVEKVKAKFQERTINLILGGLTFVAALAWNEAIKSLFETIFKKNNQLIGLFIYALIVTLVVVFVSVNLEKISKKKE